MQHGFGQDRSNADLAVIELLPINEMPLEAGKNRRQLQIPTVWAATILSECRSAQTSKTGHRDRRLSLRGPMSRMCIRRYP